MKKSGHNAGEYVILSGEGARCLTLAEYWDKNPDHYADTPTVVDRFVARCQCEASQRFKQGYDDMYFCNEDAANQDPWLCPFYDEVKAALRKVPNENQNDQEDATS